MKKRAERTRIEGGKRIEQKKKQKEQNKRTKSGRITLLDVGLRSPLLGGGDHRQVASPESGRWRSLGSLGRGRAEMEADMRERKA